MECGSVKAVLAGIFHIGGIGCDVTLSSNGIAWKSMGDAVKIKFRRKDNDSSGGFLSLDEIFGARVIHLKRDVESEKGEGPCLGLAVYTCNRMGSVRYEVDIVEFTQPSAMVCENWRCEILKLLTHSHKERPANILICLESNGEKSASHVAYRRTVEPLFTAANVHHDVIENIDTIDRTFEDIDLSNYDSVVCVGNDATVSRVVSGLLNRSSQADHGDVADISPSNFQPRMSPVPLGIIPTGPIDQIAYSVLGTDDVTTAAVHIILGNKVDVDVCSVWYNNSFLRWSFIGYFGFFASVLTNMLSTGLLGDEQRIQAGVVWTLKRKKCRTYDCEVNYVPAASGEADVKKPCRAECAVCKSASPNVHGPSRPTGDSRTRRDTSRPEEPDTANRLVDHMFDINDSCVQSVEGHFASVFVASVPGLCRLAPLGVSKFTHLSDGCLDLVLVEDDSRKEFVRFLKRLGSQKDQVDLPKVKAIRCQQVWFHLRASSPKRSEQDIVSVDGRQVTVDLTNEAPFSTTTTTTCPPAAKPFGREQGNTSDTPYSSAPSSVVSADDTDEHDPVTDDEQVENTEERLSRVDAFRKFIHLQTVASFIRRTKLLKSKEKADNDTSATAWSLDSELHHHTIDLLFKAHQGLIFLHGTGVPTDYHPNDVKMHCLAAFK